LWGEVRSRLLKALFKAPNPTFVRESERDRKWKANNPKRSIPILCRFGLKNG